MATKRLALLLALGAAVVAPQFSAPVEAAKKQPKGKLNKAQKAHFKMTKAKIKAQESRGLSQLRPVWPKYKRAKLEFDRAADSANASRTNLNALKAKLEKARTEDRKNHDNKPANAGLSPVTLNAIYKPSKKLQNLEKLYQKAEAHHQRGPKARYNAAKAKYDPLNSDYKAAKKIVDDARAQLATRKDFKNSSRANNLQVAQMKKAARANANQPVVFGQQPQAMPQYDVVPPIPASNSNYAQPGDPLI